MLKRKWVVVGANGFIGTNLCIELIRLGCEVTAFDRRDDVTYLPPEVHRISGNFLDPSALASAIEGADVVVHLVSTLTAALSNQHIEQDVRENLIGTLGVIETCKAMQIGRLIILSSGGTIYGPDVIVPTPEDAPCEPICSYGIVKLAIEKYASLYRRISQLDICVLRVSNPYGPHQIARGQGFIAAALERVLRGEAIEIWGDGSVIRDYIYIDDVVHSITAASKFTHPNGPHVFNIGSGHGRSINEVLEVIEELHGKIDVIYKSSRGVDVPISLLDIRRAESFLNWKPMVEWRVGMASAYSWMNEHLN